MPPKTKKKPEAKSFRWQAQIWEEEDRYDRKADVTILAHERRFIDQCFSEERTRPWSTRLADYLAHYGTRPSSLVGAFRRKNKILPDGREPGTLYQKFDAVGLSFILHRCRRARIGSHFHGFMHLPRELRDLVYSYALVTDSRFVITDGRETIGDFDTMFEDEEGEYYQRYHDDDENRPMRGRGPKPIFVHRDETNLLGRMNLLMGVSRTIQAEAAQVFFSRNQLIISAGKVHNPIGFNTLRTSNYWLDYNSLARDVSYSFDMRDHTIGDMENLNNGNLINKTVVDQEELPPAEALRLLHNQKVMELEFAWVDRVDAIKSMTLDRLQLSFEECYCSIGCCRKVGWILDAFIYNDLPPGRTEDEVYCNEDWKTRPPLVIEVIGWRSGKEKAMIQEKLGRLKSPQPIDIRFLEDPLERR